MGCRCPPHCCHLQGAAWQQVRTGGGMERQTAPPSPKAHLASTMPGPPSPLLGTAPPTATAPSHTHTDSSPGCRWLLWQAPEGLRQASAGRGARVSIDETHAALGTRRVSTARHRAAGFQQLPPSFTGPQQPSTTRVVMCTPTPTGVPSKAPHCLGPASPLPPSRLPRPWTRSKQLPGTLGPVPGGWCHWAPAPGQAPACDGAGRGEAGRVGVGMRSQQKPRGGCSADCIGWGSTGGAAAAVVAPTAAAAEVSAAVEAKKKQ